MSDARLLPLAIVLGLGFLTSLQDASAQESTPLDLPSSREGRGLLDGERPAIVEITAPRPSDAALSSPKTRALWSDARLARADKIMMNGKVMAFSEFRRALMHRAGIGNPKNRMASDKRLSKRALVIRCDRGQAFDYVKGLLMVCADTEVAVWKVRLAVDGKKGRYLHTDLPVDFDPIAENQPSYVEIKLRQPHSREDKRPIRSRDTRYYLGEEQVVGVSAEATIWEIGRRIAAQRKKQPKSKVKLDVGLGVPLQRVIEILDVTRQKGVESVVFVGMRRPDQKQLDTWHQRLVERLAGETTSESTSRNSGGPTKEKTRQRRRRGGPGPTPVHHSVKWLANTQNEEGFWGAAPGSIRATALCLLPFFGAGETHKMGPNRSQVRKACRWLKSRQQEDGSLSNDLEEHALATLSLCEFYYWSRSPAIKASTQAALSHLTSLMRAKRKTGLDARVDALPCAWSILAMKSAVGAKLEVDDADRKLLSQLIEESRDKKTGIWVGDERRLMATTALIDRLFSKPSAEALAVIRMEAQKSLGSHLPRAGDEADLHYRLLGTIAAYNVGGQTWVGWNQKLKDVAVGRQTLEGLEKGSWAPEDSKIEKLDRVTTTALNALVLEIYFGHGRAIGVH